MARARVEELNRNKVAVVAPPARAPTNEARLNRLDPPRPAALSSSKQIVFFDFRGRQYITWRSGVGNTDIESIDYNGEAEFRTTTLKSIHPSGRGQAPGTSWIYSRIGPDRIQVKPGGRSSFLLGDAHDKSVGLSTDAATNSRDARGWRLWRFAAWRGRVAPNSAPPTPITAVWCPP